MLVFPLEKYFQEWLGLVEVEKSFLSLGTMPILLLALCTNLKNISKLEKFLLIFKPRRRPTVLLNFNIMRIVNSKGNQLVYLFMNRLTQKRKRFNVRKKLLILIHSLKYTQIHFLLIKMVIIRKNCANKLVEKIY